MVALIDMWQYVDELNPARISARNILELMTTLEKTLVCPIRRESCDDLVQLSCGHLVSQSAWLEWQDTSTSPNQANRCVECRTEVETEMNILPMGSIGELVRNIRKECNVMRELLDRDRGAERYGSLLRVPTPAAASEPTSATEGTALLQTEKSFPTDRSLSDSVLAQTDSHSEIMGTSTWFGNDLDDSLEVWEREARRREPLTANFLPDDSDRNSVRKRVSRSSLSTVTAVRVLNPPPSQSPSQPRLPDIEQKPVHPRDTETRSSQPRFKGR